MSKYHCPICNVELEKVDRYPRYICQDCVSQATDKNGRKLLFYNVDYSGGFRAIYEDTKDIYGSHICYVKGIKCFADEARFGGIVVENIKDKGHMIYDNYERNHVVIPGREKILESFLRQDYKGIQHKWKNGFNSYSEDALTWSCFDLISNFPISKKLSVLDEIFEDSFEGKSKLKFREEVKEGSNINIYIGKQYTGSMPNETTEVDASIELPGKLIFFEAKLYSALSMAKPPEKRYDQIVRKLRIGLYNSIQDKSEFYFIFIDIAPLDKLNCRRSKKEALTPSKGFDDKWKSAWWFKYYKYGRNNSQKPIRQALEGINNLPSIHSITENMGWLTWTDLFKDILRGMVKE